MRLQPEYLGFDQRRAPTGPRPLRRLGHRRVDSEEVVTGDPYARDTIRGRPFGHPWSSDLQGLRHGDRPVIVLAEEDHRATMNAGEVQAFVKVALAGRPLAEAHVAEGPLPSPFQGQADPCRLGDLRADGARTDHDAAAVAAEVARRLAPATRGIGRAGEGGEHQLFRGKAAGQRGREVSIVEAETIAAGFERGNS